MKWVWLLCGLLYGSVVMADAADLVDDLLARTNVPGVAVGISHDGAVDIAVGGLRSRTGDVEVTPDDLWHVGSLTKSMTATLVARLVEAGQVRWDDTIGDVLGDVLPVDPAFADVTYVELLTHRSGLAANISARAARRFAGQDMLVERLDYARIIFVQDARARGEFLYSNAGYVVAGAMLQQTTGQTWEAMMQAYVFDPLGMDRAGFGAPEPDQPLGHSGFLVRPIMPGPSADNIAAMGPAGTVHVSVANMLTYLRAHALRDTEFLTVQSWDRLHTPDGDYAMGWRVTPDGYLAHDGSNTLWYAHMAFVPGHDRIVFIAGNYAGGNVASVIADLGDLVMAR